MCGGEQSRFDQVILVSWSYGLDPGNAVLLHATRTVTAVGLSVNGVGANRPITQPKRNQ
jgi:hypothetical protein